MKDIDLYVSCVNNICKKFIKKYFKVVDSKIDWINSEVGGTLEVNGYYIGFSDILFCTSNVVTEQQFFEYYEFNLEHPEQYISLKMFIEEPEARKKKEEDLIKIYEEELKRAQKNLENARKKHTNGQDS